jgi:predicted DCC family thiol-disulfide oxidoreductase YuxK
VHAEDGDADHAVPITAAGWQKIVALIGEDAAIRVHDQLPREVRVKSFIPVMMQRTARVLYQHGWSNLWHYLAD